ncbi:MAG: ThiF family adenylyltransferase [Thermoplasmata archaeon]|nr:ThiF family adenylyltransferase [Thermoplasmata archaeon]
MSNPSTKPALRPFRLPNGQILLARDVYGLGVTLHDDAGGTLWSLLRLMDGSRDLSALVRGMRKLRPRLTAGAVRRAVAELRRIGVVEERGGARASRLPAAEADRYSRNLDYFSLVTLGTSRPAVSLQRQLRDARVTILGVGAIGSSTAESLAAAGVGHLRLYDPDLVETSNLNRQLLYRSADVGRPKVDVAAEHLRALNPHLRVTAERRQVEAPGDLPPLLQDCDLFVLGADRPHEILLWTNDAAVASRTPWLENSYSGPRCAIALFVPGRTPCLRCLQHQLASRQRAQGTLDGANLFPEATDNAVIAPTAGIAGHYGALRALYFLTGLRREEEGWMLHLNLWRLDDLRVVRTRYWKGCPACGSGSHGSSSTARRRRPSSAS